MRFFLITLLLFISTTTFAKQMTISCKGFKPNSVFQSNGFKINDGEVVIEFDESDFIVKKDTFFIENLKILNFSFIHEYFSDPTEEELLLYPELQKDLSRIIAEIYYSGKIDGLICGPGSYYYDSLDGEDQYVIGKVYGDDAKKLRKRALKKK